MDHLGLNPAELTDRLVFFVAGFFVLFFLISPVAGRLMARGIASKWAFTVITAAMIFTFSLVFGVLAFIILPSWFNLTADQSMIIGLAIGFGLSATMGVYLRWMLLDPGPSQESLRFDELAVELPYDRKRREFIERRRKITGKSKT